MVIAASLTGCGSDSAGGDTASDSDSTAAPSSTAASSRSTAADETDVPYGPDTDCPADDPSCAGDQELDIYRSGRPGPNPVVIWVHGGAFAIGSKIDESEHFDDFLDKGWDLVSVDYRLTTADGANAFPTALSDVRRAVRWVKANADQHDWDPNRVAAIGHSAGGNLVGMLAAAPDEADLDEPGLPTELAAHDPSVISAVALTPVSDLATFATVAEFTADVQRYAGCAQDTSSCPAAFERGSVQTHVDSSSAPLLTFHGSDDPYAPPSQAELVAAAYRSAGIGDRFEFVLVDDGPEKFRGHFPDIDRWAPKMVEFVEGASPR